MIVDNVEGLGLDETKVATDAKGGDKTSKVQEIMAPPGTVFYDTEGDSSGAKMLKKLRCGCFDPTYRFTTEAIKISEFHCCSGGCCTRKDESIDVDEIRDITMIQTLGPGYCLFDRGHFIIFFSEKGGPMQEHHVWHIEGANKVLSEYASHVSKMNNLVMGMARPGGDSPEVFYNSKDDSSTIKCCRTVVCCGCCCFPHTIISKRHISTNWWKCSLKYVSPGTNCCACLIKQHEIVDTDQIKDLSMQRSLCDLCIGTGTIIVDAPADVSQDGVKIRMVGSSKGIFDKFDEYVNLLDNRQRIVGDHGMGR